jgi:hypothetical protein
MTSIEKGYSPDEFSILVVATQIQAAAAPDGPERDQLLLLARAIRGCASAQQCLDG